MHTNSTSFFIKSTYLFAVLRLPTIIKIIPEIKTVVEAASTITLKVLKGIISFFVIIRDTFGPNCNVKKALIIYKAKLKTIRTIPTLIFLKSAHFLNDFYIHASGLSLKLKVYQIKLCFGSKMVFK